jgi:hypothetical protein
MENKEILEGLETLRDGILSVDSKLSDAQYEAVNLIMDAIDVLYVNPFDNKGVDICV